MKGAAGVAGLNEKYFSTYFHRKTGIRFSEWVNSVRVVQALTDLPDVVHAEADHEQDRVRLWARSAQPDLDALRRAIEQSGFKVSHVHVEPGKNASD